MLFVSLLSPKGKGKEAVDHLKSLKRHKELKSMMSMLPLGAMMV